MLKARGKHPLVYNYLHCNYCNLTHWSTADAKHCTCGDAMVPPKDDIEGRVYEEAYWGDAMMLFRDNEGTNDYKKLE